MERETELEVFLFTKTTDELLDEIRKQPSASWLEACAGILVKFRRDRADSTRLVEMIKMFDTVPPNATTIGKSKAVGFLFELVKILVRRCFTIPRIELLVNDPQRVDNGTIFLREKINWSFTGQSTAAFKRSLIGKDDTEIATNRAHLIEQATRIGREVETLCYLVAQELRLTIPIIVDTIRSENANRGS